MLANLSLMQRFNSYLIIKGFDRDKMYNGFKKPGARLVSSKLISTKKVR